MTKLEIQLTSLGEIQKGHLKDVWCQKINQKLFDGLGDDYQLLEGVLKFRDRVHVP